jgi:N-acetylmuramoyl-L-alanine amidase
MLASSAATCSNADPSAESRTHQRSAVDEALGERTSDALQVLERLRRGDLPQGVDTVVATLNASAEQEGSGPRAEQTRLVAAQLLIARFELTRATRDAELADAALARAATAEPPSCAAIELRARLAQRRRDMNAARARLLEYERRCPHGADLAHVHATLALIAPAVAAAEAEARSARDDPPARRTARQRVVIDPGHGGSDPGARSAGGLSESVVTLDVARRVASRVASMAPVEVVLTRDVDRYVPLEQRAQQANDVDANLFISIHCNSAPDTLSRGVSTYVLDTQSDRVAARVAARENGDVDSDPLADPEIFRILADLRLSGQGSRSVAVAQSLQQSMVTALGARYSGVVDLGVHPARFHVLVGARMPAVLVELSFLSSPTEAARLADATYRDVLASAIATSIVGQLSTDGR